jgi:hypothetical protein
MVNKKNSPLKDKDVWLVWKLAIILNVWLKSDQF